MNYNQIAEWADLSNELEDQMLDRELEIPDFTGDSWVDPMGRTWRKVKLAYGKVGGRWCYWCADGRVVVDSIFNGNSSFFAGMLRIPYDGNAQEGLIVENAERLQKASPAPEDTETLRPAGETLPREY